jgi:hypothetical protein
LDVYLTSFFIAAFAAAATETNEGSCCDEDDATHCHQNLSHLERDCTERGCMRRKRVKRMTVIRVPFSTLPDTIDLFARMCYPIVDI